MIVLIAANIMFSLISGLQNTEWRLDKDKNEIKVYTRKVDGYAVREFRAESSVNSNFDEIMDLFEDVENYPQWIPDVTESQIIEKTDDSTYYYRMVIKAPFPVTNRDLVSEMKFVSEGENIFRIEMQAFPELVDEVDGLIRIPYSTGYWEFTIDGENLLIKNQFLSDPGGTVPSWIINSFITNNPYNTIKNLKTKFE